MPHPSSSVVCISITNDLHIKQIPVTIGNNGILRTPIGELECYCNEKYTKSDNTEITVSSFCYKTLSDDTNTFSHKNLFTHKLPGVFNNTLHMVPIVFSYSVANRHDCFTDDVFLEIWKDEMQRTKSRAQLSSFELNDKICNAAQDPMISMPCEVEVSDNDSEEEVDDHYNQEEVEYIEDIKSITEIEKDTKIEEEY